MTPEQRADKLVHVSDNGPHWKGYVSIGDPKQNHIAFEVSNDQMGRLQGAYLKRTIAGAVREAVKAEREAIAKHVEKDYPRVAAEIRIRGII